jgi:hypothetical protein
VIKSSAYSGSFGSLAKLPEPPRCSFAISVSPHPFLG